MKIVLADDERLSRLNLVQMIEGMPVPWEVAGEAVNGEQLLQLVEEHKPVIAIVDIRMPRMDGLEAIQAAVARNVSPATRWIILSGFSDFAYAQKAIQLGASEYLLKPVRSEELERALDRVSKDNFRYKLLLNKQFENDLIALYHGLAGMEHEREDSVMRMGTFYACLFLIDGSCTASQMTEWQRRFSRDVRLCLEELVRCGWYTALLALPGGEFAVVAASEPGGSAQAAGSIGGLRGKLERLIRQYGGNPVQFTALETGQCDGYHALYEQLEKLRDLACLRPVAGINRLWPAKDFIPMSDDELLKEIGKQLLDLAAAYKAKLYLPFQNGAANLEKKLALCKGEGRTKLIGNIARFLACTVSVTEEAIAGSGDIVEQLKQCGERMLGEHQSGENRLTGLVDQVIAVIERKYMEDIGLCQIAAELDITQNYLSYLFHKRTGTTFMKYLTRIRILKAKELLCDPNMQVQQVAQAVGYYSTRYFSKLFKEAVGCHPSEYSKRYKKGEQRALLPDAAGRLPPIAE
ncbi:response regulator transcription factor [Paenibacillus alkalitolerans]|uniref:response regulator transcription factor n=1 Tax=Paenibacillus alkalitolerans TaxID=2799335 RepID=UPI0018F5B6F8|nr:helix-turn-helix domain-containing protein [Paenibacillus alkalitolerans]